eukprot:TRINITY_DN371_c2_g1_i3.p1 TRINITY_DN371_c2_g1~~TRINITY_DN371_c2_g1_i3.p1  ORF type:complete len:1033 (+),score=217.93 TRINITY_DN371_c2_g1_i3:794-3892(+)
MIDVCCSVFLGKVKHFVLDEADTLFDFGFKEDINKIVQPLLSRIRNEYIQNKTPSGKKSTQFIFVAATITPSLTNELNRLFPDVRRIITGSVHKQAPNIKYDWLSVNNDKQEPLLKLINQHPKQKMIVFCNTVTCCRAVDHILQENNINSANYHGGILPNKRITEFNRFKNGSTNILVCTDIAARGLDIDNVDHVILFDFPRNVVDFIHRTGRTARGGSSGRVTAFISKGDAQLADLIKNSLSQNKPLSEISIPQPEKSIKEKPQLPVEEPVPSSRNQSPREGRRTRETPRDSKDSGRRDPGRRPTRSNSFSDDRTTPRYGRNNSFKNYDEDKKNNNNNSNNNDNNNNNLFVNMSIPDLYSSIISIPQHGMLSPMINTPGGGSSIKSNSTDRSNYKNLSLIHLLEDDEKFDVISKELEEFESILKKNDSIIGCRHTFLLSCKKTVINTITKFIPVFMIQLSQAKSRMSISNVVTPDTILGYINACFDVARTCEEHYSNCNSQEKIKIDLTEVDFSLLDFSKVDTTNVAFKIKTSLLIGNGLSDGSKNLTFKMLQNAIEVGDLVNVKYFIELLGLTPNPSNPIMPPTPALPNTKPSSSPLPGRLSVSSGSSDYTMPLSEQHYAALMSASLNYQFEVLKYLLQLGFNPNAQSRAGLTVLDSMCLERSPTSKSKKIIKYLIEYKANIDLHNAVAMGDFAIVSKLLADQNQKGLDSCRLDGASPLHLATRAGHLKIVALLLSRGANPCLVNKHGYTPLQVACQEGHLDIVKILIEFDDFVYKSFNSSTQQEGEVLIQIALDGNQTETAKFLITYGAVPNIMQAILLEDEIFVNKWIKSINTVNQSSNNNNNNNNSNRDTVDGNGLSLPNGYSPIFWATKNNKLKMVTWLLETGTTDFYHDKESILSYSCKNSLNQVASIIISKNVIPPNSDNSLLESASKGNIALVTALLEKGWDPNYIPHGQPDKTCLHVAASKGNIEMIQCLIKYGASLLVMDSQRNLPLHLAAMNGHKEATSYLHNAILRIPNALSHTPSDYL